MAITLVTQYDVDRVKQIEATLIKSLWSLKPMKMKCCHYSEQWWWQKEKCKVVVLLIKPIAFFPFSLPSPSSLLKLPSSIRKKAASLIKKHNNFARASYLFEHNFTAHNYDVKMPNFVGGRKQATTKFYFSFWTSIRSPIIHLQEGLPLFDKVSGWEPEQSRSRLEERKSPFKRRFRCRRVVES